MHGFCPTVTPGLTEPRLLQIVYPKVGTDWWTYLLFDKLGHIISKCVGPECGILGMLDKIDVFPKSLVQIVEEMGREQWHRMNADAFNLHMEHKDTNPHRHVTHIDVQNSYGRAIHDDLANTGTLTGMTAKASLQGVDRDAAAAFILLDKDKDDVLTVSELTWVRAQITVEISNNILRCLDGFN